MSYRRPEAWSIKAKFNESLRELFGCFRDFLSVIARRAPQEFWPWHALSFVVLPPKQSLISLGKCSTASGNRQNVQESAEP